MRLQVLLFFSIALANADEQPFEADFSPIQNAGNYSTLLDSVIKTGTDEAISSNVPVTIFGPSNFAFSVISNQITGIPDQELVNILLGHVILNSTITTDVLVKEGCIVATTAGGRNISIYRDPLTGAVDVDGVDVTISDIIGDYGVFHGIETVLLPGAIEFLDCPATPDFSPIAESGQYSALLGAVVETNTDFIIAVNPPVTIFGPTNSAFASIQGGDTNVSDIIADHIVINRDISSAEIVSSGCVDAEAVGGLRLAIRFDNTTNTTSINGIQIVDLGITGEYGTFHGIDGVLLDSTDYSPCTDFSPIVEAGNYETLLNVITQTRMVDFIGQFAPVTIFGPTDDAFAAFQVTNPAGIIDEELIEQHIISIDSIFFDFIARVGCYETVTTGGMTVDVRYNNSTNTTTINGIPIIKADIVGNYGVLHGIDGVLIQGVTDYTPCADFSPIAEAGDYTTFLDIVLQTRTDEIISEYSPVTFFAPTDSAFAAIQETLDDMSLSELSENVLYHHMIIFKEVFSAEVMASGCVDAETFGGSMVAIRYNSTTGNAIVNGIPIVQLEIIGNFGVVHGIDGILNGSATDVYIPCPTASPSTMPVLAGEPNEAPMVPTSNPTGPTTTATSTSSTFMSYAYASFAAAIALLVL
ncbi:unnamed protein product [Cylindrotheca closterium]|uniref:FAS1 domain-containing protein n=1 Tax=Cylindrotheca closterium TaxID=2856 RepID=A0AAD2FEK8_9STRA|nr:unnamed protein product [Cylindrotheca closterium]